MKALLICPWTRTVREVVIMADRFLAEAYAALSYDGKGVEPTWDVDCVQVLKIGETQCLLIDEDARIKLGWQAIPKFQWGGVPEWTVIGRALILDTRDSDFVGTSLTKEYVEKLVKWEEQ